MKSAQKTPLKIPLVAIAALGVIGGGITDAAAEIKYRSGTTQCGFNNFSRLNGTEDHQSVLNLRNPNGDVTIKVDRMRMFLADGSLLSEVPGSMLPTLGPRQSLSMRSWEYWEQAGLPAIPRELRPFQLVIQWSVQDGSRGYHLGANVVRQVRDGGNGAERSRHRGSCRTLELNWR